jgi:predicted small secreted protein
MKSNLTNVVFFALAAAVIAFMASGCRTVHGFGSDVRSAGNHIEHAAH